LSVAIPTQSAAFWPMNSRKWIWLGCCATVPKTLASVVHRQPGRNQLSELHPHVYGEFGYVRGLNTVTDTEGKIRARVRFTDIFVYRGGRWLAIAGQESLVNETPK
jgi:hypothetical protein